MLDLGDPDAPPVTPPPFPRTACSCAACVRCCHEQPGSCAPGDLEAIAAYLHLPLRVAALKFWASPGALVASTLTGETARIGTITPRVVHDRCIFLDDADRCTIHPVAPAGCAYFDTHMDGPEGHRRALWMIRQQATAAYQSLRRTLSPATRYRPRIGYRP